MQLSCLHYSKEVNREQAEAYLQDVVARLPGVSHDTFGDHTLYRVDKKVFVYLLDNHHGDGRLGIQVKMPKGMNDMWVNDDPQTFYRPAYMAHQGWLGVLMTSPNLDLGALHALIIESFRIQAPKARLRDLGSGV